MQFHCNNCDAVFTVMHTMDEHFYEVEVCPFCGSELIDVMDNMSEEY